MREWRKTQSPEISQTYAPTDMQLNIKLFGSLPSFCYQLNAFIYQAVGKHNTVLMLPKSSDVAHGRTLLPVLIYHAQ